MLTVLSLGLLGCGRSDLYRYGSQATFPEADGGLDAGIPLPDAGPPNTCQPIASDTYTLAPASKRPIDVLFVIDDSASMANDQEALANNFRAFISAFLTNEVDFHLGAVTTDMSKSTRRGKLVGPFLTKATPNLATAFSTMVNVGVNGSSREQGIAAAAAALSEPLVSTSNAGFLRKEADLGLVFLADEDDHATVTVTSFVSQLKALKSDNSSVSVAAIVGLQSGLFCATNDWRYVQVARAFGARGLVSTCSPNYAVVLEAIGGRLIGSQCIFGLKQPLGETLAVRLLLNGNPWFFLRRSPDLSFPNGSIELLPCPGTGGTVELIYEECLDRP